MSASVWIRTGVYRSARKCITKLKKKLGSLPSQTDRTRPRAALGREKHNQQGGRSQGRLRIHTHHEVYEPPHITLRWPREFSYPGGVKCCVCVCACVSSGMNWSRSRRLCLCTSGRIFLLRFLSVRIKRTSDRVGHEPTSHYEFCPRSKVHRVTWLWPQDINRRR